MIAPKVAPTAMIGHVAVYSASGRWGGAVASALARAGHSVARASTPEELRRALSAQRFDVLVLNVRDEDETAAVAERLENVTPPLHIIVAGASSALQLTFHRRRGGTFRYVPAAPSAAELLRLVDVTISAGGWDEAPANGDTPHTLEEIDLQELIEEASSAVYARARRKRQRFHSNVTGSNGHAVAEPGKLRRTMTRLLELLVSLAPQGALISIDAQAGRDEWLVQMSARNGGKQHGRASPLAEALLDETDTLAAASRALRELGGMLWVEVARGLAVSLTLPLAPGRREAQATGGRG